MPLRRAAVRRLAWTIVAIGSFFGPGAAVAHAHSQLVASVPAAGDVVVAAPSDIRLTFSEPIDPAHTSIDVLSGDGRVVASAIGSVDPGDAFTLIAHVPSLGSGEYTINWRALSAADGHSTSGTFSFGVGDVSAPAVAATGAGAGSIHAGHDEATVFLETESRIVADLGSMVAFGLAMIGVLVLRRPGSAGIARAGAAALLLAAVGAAGLILLGGPSSGIDLLSYLQARTGILDAIRLVVGIAAGVGGWLMARWAAVAVAGLVGLAGAAQLVLIALGGHDAAFGAAGPVVAMAVHLMAASIWLAGLLTLVWLGILPEHRPQPMVVLVPRFSGVAIVAIGLVAATGIYADWLQTGSLLSLATPYETTVAVKIGLTVAALVIGWLNYRAAGRDPRFGPRVALEAILAMSVLVATGVLASGSPPGPAAPVAIARVSSSAFDQGNASLLISPGRPGPTQFTVTLAAAAPAGATVELDLSRLDQTGETRLPLRPLPDRATWVAPGGLLPPNSRFDVVAVVRDGSGVETSRSRFAFALDATTIVSGRLGPPIDPVAIVVVSLIGAGFVALALLLAGRTLPATDRRAGRIALAGGSAITAVVAVAIAVGGAKG